MDTKLREQLLRQIGAMNITLTQEQADKLMAYLGLLVKWNRAYNLTAVRDPAEMIDRHLVDSLSVLPFIEGPRLLDVGSGPGLPGIPLAICRPDIAVTTLDSNGKKTRFQLQVKAELGLDNLSVVNARAETSGLEPFEQVISRAFASLEEMINWTAPLCRQDGVFLAMKGLYPEDELRALPVGYTLKSSHPLRVPGTDGARHLLILGRS
ncbi:MAG: 16S rRNA (guanine(527)-N(7))-methyltransferase RsmG [Oceanospirillaceae bacterium]|nr:16S rRNA (guanine(527)-N(7))-methyltransferase RsmG [Oceanospirillaceae bacterium]